MKKYIIIISFICISFIFNSEVIILENGKKLNGKIIKMDEDTITVLTQNNEMIFDRDEIISIYRSEKDYNQSIKKEDHTDTIIKNGDFSNDVFYWAAWSPYPSGIIYSVEDSEAIINIKENKNNSYVDFEQRKLLIKKGEKYTVKFQARASAIKNFRVVVQQVNRNWTSYYEKKFRLTKNIKEYKFSFRMNNETDNNTRLLFVFKYEKCKIYIDNVEIIKK